MNRRTPVLLTLSLTLTVPVAALAAGGTSPPTISTSTAGMKVKGTNRGDQPVPAFKKVDTNGDHRIEWKEARAVGVPRQIFRRYDYHHDGKLTLTDWKFVKVAMLHTSALPRPESTSLPPVPASVAKSIHAPVYGASSVTGTAPPPKSAPVPATAAHGGR